MRYFLLLLLLTPIPAFAATFVSEQELVDHWIYEFNVQSGPQEKSTVMSVGVGMCDGPINHRTKRPILGKQEICADTKEEAKVMAQKQADAFEKNLVATNQSTTSIEAARRKE